MKPRHKRIAMVGGGLAALAVAAGLILAAFQKNLVFFFTPSQVAANEAPQGKTLICFENSAHSPCLEETSRFVEIMVTRVLAETLAAQQGAAADEPQRVPIDP